MVQKSVVYKGIRKCQRNLFLAKFEVLKWHHIHSQSPVFGLAVLYLEVKFHAFGTSKHGQGKSLSLFFAALISTLGRINRANKKSLSYWQNYYEIKGSLKIILYKDREMPIETDY